MPMVIRMPHLGKDSDGYSMLGLGDIIVPALSTALLWRFDVAREVPLQQLLHCGRDAFVQTLSTVLRSSLFLPSIVGYILGLLCAYFVVVMFRLAQPALFYIVPLSQWTVLILAFRRGELHNLWTQGPPMPSAPEEPGVETVAADTANTANATEMVTGGNGSDSLAASLLLDAERSSTVRDGAPIHSPIPPV